MNARELRIGNYVELEMVYSKLNNTTFKAIIDGRYNELKPIELTEEILLKCGFILSKYKTVFILDLNNEEFKTTIQVNREGETYHICKKGLIFHSLKLKYLHQLQNLYYCLCSEELEIDLS